MVAAGCSETTKPDLHQLRLTVVDQLYILGNRISHIAITHTQLLQLLCQRVKLLPQQVCVCLLLLMQCIGACRPVMPNAAQPLRS